MLSYMLPVEEKSSSPRNLNLSLNLNSTTTTTVTVTKPPATGGGSGPIKGIMSHTNVNGNSNNIDMTCDENTKLLASERVHFANNTRILSRGLKLDINNKQMDQNHHYGNGIGGGGGCLDGGGGGSGVDTDGDADSGGGGSTTGGGCLKHYDHTTASEGGDSDESKGNVKKGGKLSKIGTKNVTLKRVSFGSSKGSMVETLVFETPTPLPEHAEREFGFPVDTVTSSTISHGIVGNKYYNNNIINHSNHNNNSCLDDSGIEMQEELERSKVRVTFFQSSKPQQISPPDSHIHFRDSNLPLLSESFIDGSTISDDTMTATTATQPSYDRQISAESGWDNPFRPGGDLSREADEIVNLIKGGKPITPTSEVNQSIANGSAQKDIDHTIENGTAVVDGATKVEVSQTQATPAQNGTKSPQGKTTTKTTTTTTTASKPPSTLPGNKTNGDAKSTAPQTQIIPGPISASHVVIDDKKKKKCTCCVIQ